MLFPWLLLLRAVLIKNQESGSFAILTWCPSSFEIHLPLQSQLNSSCEVLATQLLSFVFREANLPGELGDHSDIGFNVSRSTIDSCVHQYWRATSHFLASHSLCEGTANLGKFTIRVFNSFERAKALSEPYGSHHWIGLNPKPLPTVFALHLIVYSLTEANFVGSPNKKSSESFEDLYMNFI